MSVIITGMNMPENCGSCPVCIYTADEKKAIGYCNTSDEDYYCKTLERFMEYDEVDGGQDILGKPSDCTLKSIEELISKISKLPITDTAVTLVTNTIKEYCEL